MTYCNLWTCSLQKTPDFGPLEVNSSLEDGSGPTEDTMLSALGSGQEIGHAGRPMELLMN